MSEPLKVTKKQRTRHNFMEHTQAHVAAILTGVLLTRNRTENGEWNEIGVLLSDSNQ